MTTIKKKYDQTTKTTLDQTGQISKTKQSFKDEANVNSIIEKYNKTGQFPQLLQSNPKYGDFSTPISYQDSLNTILLANEQFNALSSKVRKKFNNDPTEFLQFVSNPQNKEEMYELGLAVKPPKVYSPMPDAEALKASLDKNAKKPKGANQSVPDMDTN